MPSNTRKLAKTLTAKRQLLLWATIALLPMANASAEWTGIGEGGASVPSEFSAYVDFDTTALKDKIGSVWTLNDFKKPKAVSGQSISSTKVHFEYMCDQNKRRMLEFSWYAGKMGSGEVVFTKNEVDVWRDFTSNTLDDQRRDAACGKSNKPA